MGTNKVKLIGIGAEGEESLLPQYRQWIETSEVLVGGRRQLDFFPNYQGEKWTIKGGWESLIDRLVQESRTTVILASGDPLFYGIGEHLAERVPLAIYPNPSSVQLAFAKANIGYHDAYITSLHGRSIHGLAQRIDGKAKVALLTDQKNSPNAIASYLLSFDMTEYDMIVCEDLGGKEERVRRLSIAEAVDETYHPLNIVLLIQTKQGPTWPLGINDEEFYQRKPENGLITKKEIRLLSLAALKIREDSVVWDIGTCTGSMAIEAARMAREGAVFAIEKSASDLGNFHLNAKKFRADITVLQEKAPNGLATFPDPNAIFIGGTAGNMEKILTVCCARLKENGTIVVNAATIESLAHALECFRTNGFETEITLAQIARSKPVLQLTRFDALNPIYIIAASKIKGEKE